MLNAVLSSIFASYQAYPRLSNAVTGSITFSLGDAMAQRLEKKTLREGKEQHFDFVRSAQLALLGFVMNGFFLHHWYHNLDRFVGKNQKSKLGVALKMSADQFIYAPFSISTFFYFSFARQHGFFSRETNSRFEEKMRASFVTTYLADCMLWPGSNFVNFRFVPLSYRPTWTSTTQLVWQTYLSIASSVSPPVKADASRPSA